MTGLIRTIVGFLAILLVGLGGVAVSETMKLGNMNAIIMTVDNVTHTR